MACTIFTSRIASHISMSRGREREKKPVPKKEAIRVPSERSTDPERDGTLAFFFRPGPEIISDTLVCTRAHDFHSRKGDIIIIDGHAPIYNCGLLFRVRAPRGSYILHLRTLLFLSLFSRAWAGGASLSAYCWFMPDVATGEPRARYVFENCRPDNFRCTFLPVPSDFFFFPFFWGRSSTLAEWLERFHTVPEKNAPKVSRAVCVCVCVNEPYLPFSICFYGQITPKNENLVSNHASRECDAETTVHQINTILNPRLA